MALEEAKKRKACQSCTKAKAKCSPFEDRLDICYRCQRLKKECIFDDTIKKRGPKNRSRVKQLEQRVDTLIDLLANGQALKDGQSAATRVWSNDSATPIEAHLPLMTPPESAADLEGRSQNAEDCFPAAVQKSDYISYSPVEPSCLSFDPVAAGLLDDRTADSLLRDYRDSYASAFPFVVIPPTVDSKALRQSQPFLFHALLTVTTRDMPGLQGTLAVKLKEQVALRIINHSHMSLELLQGLLVFTAWYHYYYDPMKQQLATMVQLCVAMIQELGFSKNPQNAKKKITMDDFGINAYSSRPLAEKRAYLGTFYLAAVFSQAWRRPTTMTHTRYMDQCCQHLSECREYVSDVLITPLTQLGALLCRVHNYFSYDDIENAEVNGENLVHLSIGNFDRELSRIAESVPETLLQSNPTLRLSIRLLRIWIYESAVHDSLWNSSSGPSTPSMTAIRSKTLFRCLNAVKSYLNTIITIPNGSLHHLSFPSWSAWCYTCIVASKLVFLTDEREQKTGLTETFTEVFNMIKNKSLDYEPTHCSLPVEVISTDWSPVSVAKEGEVLTLFHKMYDKMRFTLPRNSDGVPPDPCTTHPLCRIAYFAKHVLCNLIDRLNEHVPNLVSSNEGGHDAEETDLVVLRDNWTGTHTNYASQRNERARVPLLQNMNFNSMNFDSIAPPENSMPLDGSLGGWLWNTAMDDFTIPPF